MSKDYFKDKNDENTDYDYDDEMSRKAVGKLMTGLDDDGGDNGPLSVPGKPVVRAIRINSEKIKQEKISTSVYDESRAIRPNTSDDAIVTGFKEEEVEETPPEIEVPPPVPEEDIGDKVRTRRPNILREESSGDREEREKYRKQFLGGYTDHRRKGLDLMTGAAPENGETRRRPAVPLEDEPVKRVTSFDSELDKIEKEPESVPRRRPRENTLDAADIKQPKRPRRQRESSEEDGAIVTSKRSERKERQPMYAANAAAQPVSYDAPIFKIIAAVFVVMLVLMVILVININGANSRVRELEAEIVQFEEDVEELDALRAQNSSFQSQVGNLTEERASLQLQLADLEARLMAADASNVPQIYTPGSEPVIPGGTQSYTVRSGDNLSRIAASFNLGPNGVDAIMQANGLPNTNITVGQTLIIPSP
ncbi:MAG: LysM peptidoglycan-binding domain-containing protein [Defluviitaleaceae bacterium]|nr:LysM peptidoglycan-binding domain-containing protein [Defluviitaleaceae bacterium]